LSGVTGDVFGGTSMMTIRHVPDEVRYRRLARAADG
jgi:hypothetical protein